MSIIKTILKILLQIFSVVAIIAWMCLFWVLWDYKKDFLGVLIILSLVGYLTVSILVFVYTFYRKKWDEWF